MPVTKRRDSGGLISGLYDQLIIHITGGILKKQTASILLGLLVIPALTGCTGKLVPSGSQLDSEVPETIGDYRIVTATDLASNHCDGSPAVETTSERTYSGAFLYSKASNAITGNAVKCSEYATRYNISTGNVRIELSSPALFLTGKMEESADQTCKVDRLDNGEVLQCVSANDGVAIMASSPRIGSQENQEQELEDMMSTFMKKAKIELPDTKM